MSTKRSLGVWTLTALVTGNMIGSGIFLLPAAIAAFGTIGIVAWSLTALGALLLASVFAKLSQIIPKIGGPYAYCREAFGDFIGFEIAYNYWVALWVGNAAIVVALVGYLSFFWPSLSQMPYLALGIKLLIVWLLTLVNILGVQKAGKLQVVTTILKLLPLLLIIGFGFFFIHPSNLADFNISGQSNTSALTAAAAMTLWSFIGLESATVPAEDADNPDSVAKATMLGTIITALIYISSTVAILGIIPAKVLMHSNAPYADAATAIFSQLGSHFGWTHFGLWGGSIVAMGAVISCFGALNGWTLLQGQVPLAAARDQLFPAVFKKTTATGTPITGLIVSSTLVSLLLLLTINNGLVKQFTLITLLATLASLIPYFFTCMSELLIFIKWRERFNGQRLIGAIVICLLASAYAFWAIIGAGYEVLFYGTLLFLSGLPIYVWMEWHNSQMPIHP